MIKIIFYISIGFFILAIIIFIAYLLFSQSRSLKQKNSLNITKNQFIKIFLKKITGNKNWKIQNDFSSPKMGKNKSYYLHKNKDNPGYSKWKIDLRDIKDNLFENKKPIFILSKYKSESKRIWNIAQAIEEALGSTYIFSRKRSIILLFNPLTFLLAAFGSAWPIILVIALNYGIRAIINDNFSNNGELFISSLLLLVSILSGTLSIAIRQAYVYKQFLKIPDKIEFSQEEIKKIKKIIFSKIFFGLGVIFFLPLDFIKEFYRSWLCYLIFWPFFIIIYLFCWYLPCP